MLVGWFTHVHGTVFVDDNGNGKRDPGEQAVAAVRADRPRARQLADGPVHEHRRPPTSNGAYDIREAYPLGKWLVLEAFNTRYRTTGITYQGENETKATTKLGGLVDINFLPIIGLGGEIDWGVAALRPGTRTAASSARSPTTRPATSSTRPTPSTEGYQPGIPDVTGPRSTRPYACTATDRRATWPTSAGRARRSCRSKVRHDPANPGHDGRQPRRRTAARSSRARRSRSLHLRGVGSRRAAARPGSTTASR